MKRARKEREKRRIFCDRMAARLLSSQAWSANHGVTKAIRMDVEYARGYYANHQRASNFHGGDQMDGFPIWNWEGFPFGEAHPHHFNIVRGCAAMRTFRGN
jgi:hypothetical protein